MPTTEEQVKSVISEYGGEARRQNIARELKVSLDYVNLICEGLRRRGEIILLGGFYSLPVLKEKLRRKIRRSTGHGGRRSTRDTRQGGLPARLTFESSFSAIPGITQGLIDRVKAAGYHTTEFLADAPIARLMQEAKLELYEAARLINHARKVLGKIKDNEVVEEEQE